MSDFANKSPASAINTCFYFIFRIHEYNYTKSLLAAQKHGMFRVGNQESWFVARGPWFVAQ